MKKDIQKECLADSKLRSAIFVYIGIFYLMYGHRGTIYIGHWKTEYPILVSLSLAHRTIERFFFFQIFSNGAYMFSVVERSYNQIDVEKINKIE
ncbi:hypothetical protein SAMN04487936_106326 [Halobacillus dabanensis]|uniref:Uncharacterized protein n=1 Tax=Halobacillus dabanensis TaxID=240302 RepID=A0A1I3WF71_HALDA|nr:hypothetical protein SAMN04487936_106326 [Halobacillus dabanensis]